MAQAGKQILVVTDPATQFRGAIAQNAMAVEAIDVRHLGLGGRADVAVRAVMVLSMEDLDWEVWIFRQPGGSTASFALATLAGAAVPLDKGQIGGAGLHVAYVDGLLLPAQDEADTSNLYVGLVCRSAAGKTAGDAGAVSVRLAVEPTLGW